MSLDFKLTNDNLINYARTNDAHEAFVQSVNNGQTRLALEVLVELVDGIISKLDEITNEKNPESNDSMVEKLVLDEKTNQSVGLMSNNLDEQDLVVEEIKPKTQKPKIDKETNISV